MRRPGEPGRLSFWFRGSSGLRHCRLTPLHLLYRDVFDVGCQPPLVAEAVPNPRAAVSVELVLRLTQGLAAHSECALVRRIDIVHIQVCRGTCGLELSGGVAEHDYRVADAHFRVHDRAVGPAEALPLLRAECFLQELDEVGGTADDEI